MHIQRADDAPKVFALATRVIQGMTENAALFPTPDPALEELKADTALLEELMGTASNGDREEKGKRDNQSIKVFGKLDIERGYVNKVAKGDRAVILSSGFDASDDPNPRPIPDKGIIEDVEDGASPHSAKVVIQALGGDVSYHVQVCPAPLSEQGFKSLPPFSNSRKIIIENLERGKEIFIRVAGFNSHGQGEWSEPAAFIPQ